MGWVLGQPPAFASSNPNPSAALRGALTMTSAKMSPAYSRSPSSPSALSASASPGGAHGPGGLSWLPSGMLSGSGALGGLGEAAAGLCKGEGWGSAPGERPGPGGGTLAAASHQHPPRWRPGTKPSAPLPAGAKDPPRRFKLCLHACALNTPHLGRCRGDGECYAGWLWPLQT